VREPFSLAGKTAIVTGGYQDPPAHRFRHHPADYLEAFVDCVNRAFSAWDGQDYTRYQGTYASEWYWAKILHARRTAPAVAAAAPGWVELCDWIPALLTGRTAPEATARCACPNGSGLRPVLWMPTPGPWALASARTMVVNIGTSTVNMLVSEAAALAGKDLRSVSAGRRRIRSFPGWLALRPARPPLGISLPGCGTCCCGPWRPF
jgi:hypothetical protein